MGAKRYWVGEERGEWARGELGGPARAARGPRCASAGEGGFARCGVVFLWGLYELDACVLVSGFL